MTASSCEYDARGRGGNEQVGQRIYGPDDRKNLKPLDGFPFQVLTDRLTDTNTNTHTNMHTHIHEVVGDRIYGPDDRKNLKPVDGFPFQV